MVQLQQRLGTFTGHYAYHLCHATDATALLTLPERFLAQFEDQEQAIGIGRIKQVSRLQLEQVGMQNIGTLVDAAGVAACKRNASGSEMHRSRLPTCQEHQREHLVFSRRQRGACHSQSSGAAYIVEQPGLPLGVLP